MKRRTLFWTLVLAFMFVSVVGASSRSLFFTYMARDFFARQLLTMMEASARAAAQWVSPDLTPDGWQGQFDLRERLPWFSEQTESRLWLVGRDGVVLVDTDHIDSQRGAQLDGPALTRVFDGETASFARDTPWLPDRLMVGVPVMEEGVVKGAAFLFLSLEPLQSLMDDFNTVVTQTALLAICFCLLAGFLIARPFVRPLEKLREFALRLGQGDFEAPGLGSPITEFRELAGALKAAAINLDASFVSLREEKQRVQMLLESMGDGVVAVDEAGHVQAVNPVAQDLLGVTAQGQPVREAGFPEPLTSALLQVGNGSFQEKAVFACGGQEIRAIVAPVISAEDERAGAVAILENITPETRLRRAQERFVANVSHELRAPLAALSAGVEAMQDNILPGPEQPRFLALMYQEIGRLHRLTDDLLALSRLDAGIGNLVRETFDITEVVQEAVETFSHRARTQGVAIVMDAVPAPVVASRDRVAQVLANLLDNAIRFTSQGGSIIVAVEMQGEVVKVSVRDTGLGIDPERLPYIWDRFYKVDDARARDVIGGTGLGLAIVRGWVEQLGGTVGVKSRPGVGSTFFFTLEAATDWHPFASMLE